MKLVVGLGNPGKEYENTRHNVGFKFIDFYLGNELFKEKNSALFLEKIINGEKVIFLKPLTYMNDSGRAVRKYLDYYKISVEDLLVIYDDMDFEVGKFKIKKNGSAAGHNGIKSIINNIRTEEFKRIRIGISRSKEDKVNYVLGNFGKVEQKKLDEEFIKIKEVLDNYFKMDFETLMSKYNQR